MSQRERYLIMLLQLLKEESDALRSVLSECDGYGDKMQFSQMVRANILRDAIDTLEYLV